MTEAVIFDTRHLSEDDRDVYSGHRRITLAPNLLGGWVPYCLKHDLGLRLATREEARKGSETKGWCFGCIEEAKRPEETDLSQLRYAQSEACGCMRAWRSIRVAPDFVTGTPQPRCEGCGAVPTFLHWPKGRAYDKGGQLADIVCGCGHKADWAAELEWHVTDQNKAIGFQHVGFGRYTRG